jgi:hypothetical protein
MDPKKISAIAQAFNDVCGTSDGSTSIKHRFDGSVLHVTFTSVVHFAEERSLREQVKRETERSVVMITDCMAKVSKQFSSLYGSSLRPKEVRSSDNVEIISATATSPRKIAYYRRHIDFEVP